MSTAASQSLRPAAAPALVDVIPPSPAPQSTTAIIIISPGGVGTTAFMKQLAADLAITAHNPAAGHWRMNARDATDEIKHSLPEPVMWHLLYHLVCRYRELNDPHTPMTDLIARLHQPWPSGDSWRGGGEDEAPMAECAHVRPVFWTGPPLLTIQCHYRRGIAGNIYASLQGSFSLFSHQLRDPDYGADGQALQQPQLPHESYADFVSAQADKLRQAGVTEVHAAASWAGDAALASQLDLFGVVRQFALWAQCRDVWAPTLVLDMPTFLRQPSLLADFVQGDAGVLAATADALRGYERLNAQPTLLPGSVTHLSTNERAALEGDLALVAAWYDNVWARLMQPLVGTVVCSDGSRDVPEPGRQG